jgi:hypothetical protein
MLLWDCDLPMPSNDLFEVQEPPAEVLAVKTQSRGHPVSNNLTIAQTSGGKPTSDRPKAPFVSQINPINIHTQESPKLDYNIVEYLKRLKANVSVMDMCIIPQQNDFLLQDLKIVETPITNTDQGENPSTTNLRNKPTINACSEYKKGKPFVPPFLLTFEFFNRNLHNCLVDSGASSNVMPLSLCKKLNAVSLKSDKHVIQLDKTQVKVMGELKDVMIKMETHLKFVQVIDIVMVDIPKAYGLLLSRYWSEKLNGYFSTDWDHLWLPLKGHTNIIRIDRERYRKHTVTDLEALNEPSSTDFPMLGNYSHEFDFFNFSPLPYDVPLTQKSEMTFQENVSTTTEETLFCQEPLLETPDETRGKGEVSKHEKTNDSRSQVWTLYFDGSKL